MRLIIATFALSLCAACDDGDSASEQMQPVDPVDGAVADAAVDAALPDGATDDASAPDADLPAPDMAVEPEEWPNAPVTDERGPFNVGYTVIEVAYDAPVGPSPRMLRTALWYPTNATVGGRVFYGGLIDRPEVFGEAEPIALDGPVMVFSHGNAGFAEQSFFLTEYFASHGWLVAAPDHTGNTFSDFSAPIQHMFELRPQDISAVIDALEVFEPGDPLADRVDNGVLLTGHSFGGYTTLAVGGAGFAVDALRTECREMEDPDPETCDYLDESADRYAMAFRDPRVVAGVPLTPAGASFFRENVADVAVPMLVVTAGRDQTLPNEVEGDPLWTGLSNDGDIRLDFPNAGHFSFTSFCGRLGNFGADDGCGMDFLDPELIHQVTQEYALAFGRRHLEEDAGNDALLDGAETPYSPDVDHSLRP